MRRVKSLIIAGLFIAILAMSGCGDGKLNDSYPKKYLNTDVTIQMTLQDMDYDSANSQYVLYGWGKPNLKGQDYGYVVLTSVNETLCEEIWRESRVANSNITVAAIGKYLVNYEYIGANGSVIIAPCIATYVDCMEYSLDN